MSALHLSRSLSDGHPCCTPRPDRPIPNRRSGGHLPDTQHTQGLSPQPVVGQTLPDGDTFKVRSRQAARPCRP